MKDLLITRLDAVAVASDSLQVRHRRPLPSYTLFSPYIISRLASARDRRFLFGVCRSRRYGSLLSDILRPGGPSVAEIATQKITLAVADGSTMDAYVARPANHGKYPAILVFQEAFGVTAHIRDIAERFAKAGLVAIAPELFHRTAAPGAEIAYNDTSTAMQHARAGSTEQLVLDIRSAYEWLTKDSGVHTDRIASVGFCMGGRASFLACAKVPLQAAISFYGGGIAPTLLPHVAELRAPILFFWGGKDKHIGQDQIRAIVDECKRVGKPYVNVEFSEADHAFFRDVGPAYHPGAASLAWNLTEAFLHLHVREPHRRARIR
jgi:carboxymethylenebutenolidase